MRLFGPAITSATAIVATAQLSEMIANYRAALSIPLRCAYTYAHNPLRSSTTLVACVTTSPCAVGGGMCEFQVVVRAGHRYAPLRCIAWAGIAMHVRVSDMVRMTGANIKRNNVGFFGVESISGAD